MGWREGDMAEGDLWPADVVRSFIEAAARQHGQQSVWTGVAQLVAHLDFEVSRIIRDAADQDEKRAATHRFHSQTIDELRHENLSLQSQVRAMKAARG